MDRLRKTTILSKITTISSWVWFACVLGFVAIIFASTKGFTSDPCYGTGCPENAYLLPMLGTLFLGTAFFGLTMLAGVLRLALKAPRVHTFFSSVKATVFTVFVVVLFLVYFIGTIRGGFMGTKANYTGQQLFDSVNEYRVQNGKNAVVLDQYICDNLVERYLAVKNPDAGHAGFEEWVENEGVGQFAPLAELYVTQTYTTQDAIKFWSGSPGHRLSLLGDFNIGCAYAVEGGTEGAGVVVFGNKK